MRLSPTPWFIAVLAFLILGFTRGLHSSFGVCYVALLDTFGWSRGATAGVFSMVLTVDAILSPLVGYLLDRFDTKNRLWRLSRPVTGTSVEQHDQQSLATLHILRFDL